MGDLGKHHLSESVFVGLSNIVGSSETVIMRREMVDLREMVINQVIGIGGEIKRMNSGSFREGFRLLTSDMDFMIWRNDHTVIWELDQAQNYDLSRKTLILSDCKASPPGFALLELLTPTYRLLENTIVIMYDRFYISSSKYRKLTCSVVMPPNSKEHGPCGSGVMGGDREYDAAHCFVSDFWPPPASKWVDRSHIWPPSYVVDDIVRNGCHFVAIGHKLGKHTDEEWRISFSLAEQKLVYSMNHCQFLTYGLLKFFLKESINDGLNDENILLCSYHMKTAVFWVIQQNTMTRWCPQNFLECFWVCFKLILKWVYEGVCPNFFIPGNNMFLSKIHGEAQYKLFLRLHKLYEKGLVSTLLHIPSIWSSVMSVLQNPRQSVGTAEHIRCLLLFKIHLFYELSSSRFETKDIHQCMRFFYLAEKLIISSPTPYQVLMLRRFSSTVLQNTAFLLHKPLTIFAPFNVYTRSVINKKVYLANKKSIYMLKLAAKFGSISDMLYIAMFYYKTLRYKEALTVIEMTKFRLAMPFLIYVYMLSSNAMKYNMLSESIERQSWSTKIRHDIAWDIHLFSEICYINELVPEQQSVLQSSYPVLLIPHSVVLKMLEILCFRHVEPVRAQSALHDLQNLVHRVNGMLTMFYMRDIAWQILGICQQISGNYQAALYSYQQALRHTSQNFQTATLMRIQKVMKLINRNQL